MVDEGIECFSTTPPHGESIYCLTINYILRIIGCSFTDRAAAFQIFSEKHPGEARAVPARFNTL